MTAPRPPRVHSDLPFYIILGLLGGLYAALITAMLAADLAYTSPSDLQRAFTSPEIRAAVWLSLVSCSAAAIMAVWVAIPLGYLLSRTRFPGRSALDILVDIPIVLPPLVVGLSLLVLFQTPAGAWFQRNVMTVTYAVPAVVIAQFAVSTAFAVRTMRVTFDQIDPRAEDVARSLGCTRFQAFWRVTLPEARRGVLTAFTLAWARAIGEFGPILVFAGATRLRTEVLFHQRVPRTEYREPRGGAGGVVPDDRGGCGCTHGGASLRPPWHRTDLSSRVVAAPMGRPLHRARIVREEPVIAVESLGIRQGVFALDGVTFTVPTGVHAVLMGRTGSGKTTILETIVGLRRPTAGRVLLGSEDVTALPPAAREIGYVPQDAVLFKTMTVWENLAFALTIRNAPGQDVEVRVRELAEQLGLTAILSRLAVGLSGGESQRVALGRALAFRPKVLLLDEPLNAVDEDTRDRLTGLLRGLRSGGITVLHVTHNRAEAELLGDLILQFEDGKVISGSVAE